MIVILQQHTHHQQASHVQACCGNVEQACVLMQCSASGWYMEAVWHIASL
jgi:hypothetical protein